MSAVTDMLLITAIEDGGEVAGHTPNADRLINYLRDAYGLSATGLIQVQEMAGGNKVMQCNVFAGAINHLDAAALVECFANIDWEYPEKAQLLLKGEQENTFTSHILTEE